MKRLFYPKSFQKERERNSSIAKMGFSSTAASLPFSPAHQLLLLPICQTCINTLFWGGSSLLTYWIVMLKM